MPVFEDTDSPSAPDEHAALLVAEAEINRLTRERDAARQHAIETRQRERLAEEQQHKAERERDAAIAQLAAEREAGRQAGLEEVVAIVEATDIGCIKNREETQFEAAKGRWDLAHVIARDIAAAIRALRNTPVDREAGRRWRHVKRGTEYVEVGRAYLQTSRPVTDMTPMVVYKGDSGMWVRPGIEFEDGRFVEISALRDTPAAPEIGKNEGGGAS